MDFTPYAAVISLVGVIAPGVVGGYVAERQIRQKYREALYQKRLEIYPSLYKLMSEYIKTIHNETATLESLRAFSLELDAWDSAHSILLSPLTTSKVYILRHFLRVTFKPPKEQPAPPSLWDLGGMMSEVENALRTEMGIFAGAGIHNPSTIRRVVESRGFGQTVGLFKRAVASSKSGMRRGRASLIKWTAAVKRWRPRPD